jgi:hypothetical protein
MTNSVGLLTFDYEIFFGRNYLPMEEVLFRPTDELLVLAREASVPLNFFVDVFSASKAKQLGADSFYAQFVRQLNKARAAGHDLQMHFHPHWHNATYDPNSGGFFMDSQFWSYGQLVERLGQNEAEDIFRKNHDFFCAEFGCAPIAFRAGGFTTGPRESELIRSLKKFGYVFDSSVVPGHMYKSAAQFYDYLNCPTEDWWPIDEVGRFTSRGAEESSLYELPVSTCRKSIRYYAVSLWSETLKRCGERLEARGSGISERAVESHASRALLSFDRTSVADLPRLKFTFNEMRKSQKIITIVCHPKAVHSTSIQCLSRFLSWCEVEHPDFRWTTYAKLRSDFFR